MDITPLSPVSMTGVHTNPEEIYRELYAESTRPAGERKDRNQAITGSAMVALIEAVVTQPSSPATPPGFDQVA